jgi:5-methylcytosine-specific restriction endonuclease McrA
MEENVQVLDNIKPNKHKTKREISERLRFRILMRDGFSCKSCGRSPVKELGVELHVDHIIPWSKGGETVPDNLETKCEKCNLGKGNAFNV